MQRTKLLLLERFAYDQGWVAELHEHPQPSAACLLGSNVPAPELMFVECMNNVCYQLQLYTKCIRFLGLQQSTTNGIHSLIILQGGSPQSASLD